MQYEHLDPDKIVETVDILSQRINERFPKAGLNQVCRKLLEVAGRARQRAAEIDAPILWVRWLSAAVVLLLLLMVAGAIASAASSDQLRLHDADGSLNLSDLMQLTDSILNELVAIGVSIFFLATLEVRLKRRKVLQAIHELRVISHIIDMHQLTKDPERLQMHGPDTASSPKRTMTPFELNRYLDYCSEMLAIVGKVAALYVQNFPDQPTVSAVNDVEDLTTGLSRKIWQKIMSAHGGERRTSG